MTAVENGGAGDAAISLSYCRRVPSYACTCDVGFDVAASGLLSKFPSPAKSRSSTPFTWGNKSMSVLETLLTSDMRSAGVGTSSRTDSGGNYIAYGVQPGSYAMALQPVMEVVDGELKKEAVEAARSLIEAAVPRKYQELQTSGLQADLKRGRNRFDVNLSTQR